jgi:hypothetical protein
MLADVLTKNCTARVKDNLINHLLGNEESNNIIQPTPKRERIYRKILEQTKGEY